ncbi:MAG: Crp/Fnr family transcriptional regulator [Rhizobiales bacterium]|nr:Crp/Fnr family transcriptional regulator [Hyphomicrobiales bacterium]
MPGTTFDIDAIAAGGGDVLSFQNGATIYERGEPGTCAFIVTRGRVRIENGVAMETVRAGEIFGEASLIDGGPRLASAVAAGPTEVRAIDGGLFRVLVRDDSDFTDAVMRLMVRRLRATTSALATVETGASRPALRVIAGG